MSLLCVLLDSDRCSLGDARSTFLAESDDDDGDTGNDGNAGDPGTGRTLLFRGHRHTADAHDVTTRREASAANEDERAGDDQRSTGDRG